MAFMKSKSFKYPGYAEKPFHKIKLLKHEGNYYVKTVAVIMFFSKKSAVNFKRNQEQIWHVRTTKLKQSKQIERKRILKTKKKKRKGRRK